MNAHWNGIDATGACRGASCCGAAAAGSPRWPWPGFWPRSRGPRRPIRAIRWPRGRRIFPRRAKRVIFLFMHGGPSQVDTFDYKPLLDRDHGKPLPFAKPRVRLRQDGQPAALAVQVPAIRAERHRRQRAVPAPGRLTSTTSASSTRCTARTRGTAGRLLELHTGSDTFVRPSMGSWITYGLGTENQDLPGFITICPNLSHGGVNNWSSAFLPAVYQGTPIGNAGIPSDAGQDSVHHERRDLSRRCSGSSST